eukprot:CAMPEP_0206841482 /NCGR_PEP_ID=MMETSP0975-20121206/22473_1 /ASSEMBLY_ACC=CAM_ASM_000399 /TAXON_ID=483370 /ORGANISM="non described non described, Strain CCMP2097" /LENGTH=41 /DNA_ID= /DNA_START= /DNA_END= /DNA_ORIENTATION=
MRFGVAFAAGGAMACAAAARARMSFIRTRGYGWRYKRGRKN